MLCFLFVVLLICSDGLALDLFDDDAEPRP